MPRNPRHSTIVKELTLFGRVFVHPYDTAPAPIAARITARLNAANPYAHIRYTVAPEGN